MSSTDINTNVNDSNNKSDNQEAPSTHKTAENVSRYVMIGIAVIVWIVVAILGYVASSIAPTITITKAGAGLPGLNLIPQINKKSVLSFQNFSPYGEQTMKTNLINVNNRETEYPLQEKFYNFTTQPLQLLKPVPEPGMQNRIIP